MHPMYLQEVEHGNAAGAYATRIAGMRAAGVPIPQIMHLFAYKPDRTDFLAKFSSLYSTVFIHSSVFIQPPESPALFVKSAAPKTFKS